MTFLTNWEDFEKAAERLYLQDPMKARFVTKYDHSEGSLGMKMTDDVVCIQFKTDAAQDVRRLEKFVNNLMRHMASREHNWNLSNLKKLKKNQSLKKINNYESEQRNQ